MARFNYGNAICQGFRHLLKNHPEVFVIGQGLWAPWYVGSSMQDLDKDFGIERVIDSPVSEVACTGAALGAGLCGKRAIVVHPRVDFMILAIDQIVTQAAKWSSMFGGQASPSVVIRGIVNRGGEQGAQHSQALHSWFAHIPGLRVVMPANPKDARDLLIASSLNNGPVLYIDDRWLYELQDEIGEPEELVLADIRPRVVSEGEDVTLVGASYSTQLCVLAAEELKKRKINAEVIDLRVINPLYPEAIIESVKKTGRLCVVDGGWQTCGLAGEVIARVSESLPPSAFLASPQRVTIADAPAPTSKVLEGMYYPKTEDVVEKCLKMFVKEKLAAQQ